MWSEQDGTEWYPRQATNYNSVRANDDAGARFDIVAQTRAQVAWMATVRNDMQMYLEFENDSECPAMSINVRGAKGLRCVHGMAFGNSSDAQSLGLLLLNACDLAMNVTVRADDALGAVIDVWTYGADGYGSNTARFVDCAVWPGSEFGGQVRQVRNSRF